MTRDGSLRRQVLGVLPAEVKGAYDRLLREYWDAIVEQEKKAAPRKSRFEIMATERFGAFTREAQAAFQRLEKSGTLLFRYFFDKVSLSEEQAGAIRALLDEFVEESKGMPTKAQEQRVFVAVMSHLDTKQQTALIRYFKEREKPDGRKNPAPVKEPRDAERSPAPAGR
jgi:hypothetical protein